VAYPGTAGLHGVPTRLVGVQPIRTSLPPYSGQALAAPVASWDADGCYLDVAAQGGYSWKALYLQPGCFVYVSGGAGENSGLYRIASVAGGTTNATAKAVLTNALTKVKIAKVNQAEDVSVNFPVGSMVSWRSRPSQSQGEADRTHRAYIMYVEQPALSTDAYLYLGTFSGGTDFAVQGSTSFKAAPNAQGTETFNQFGLVELEAGANQNANVAWTTPPGGGTVLHNHLSTATKEVVAVTPAGAPVAFARGTFNPAYSIIPCSPPGFLLNPAVVLGGESTAVGGTFRAHCHVLTTVRDNLLSGGLSATRGSAAQGSSLFGPGYRASLDRLLRWIHVGDTSDATDQPNKGTILSTEFGQTRQVLGHALYTVVFANAPTNLQVGVEVVFQSGITPKARAVVAALQGTRLVFKDVVSLVETDVGQQDPISIGYGLVGQAGNVTVSSVIRPQMLFRPWAGALTPYTPTEGLDAAYHADYSSNPYVRGRRGLGSRIYAASYRPLTVVLRNESVQAAFAAESPRRSTGQSYTVIRSGPVGMTSTDMALEVVGGTTLRIWDANTGSSGVLLSSASDTALALGLGTNIIGALNTLKGSLDDETDRIDELTSLNESALAAGVLSGLGVSAGAGLLATVTSGFVVKNGTRLAVPGASVILTDNASQSVVYDVSGEELISTTSAPTSDQVPLAYLTTSAGSVVLTLDTRLTVGPLNHRVDLHVGGAGAHFTTLRAAVDFVNVMSATGVANGNRSWRIFVRGNTTETDTIVFLTDNVSIVGAGPSVLGGVGGSSQDVARITWSGNRALFDLGGSSGITFRDLALYYDATAAASSSTISRVAFDDSSGSDPTKILIERVSVDASSGIRMHGYLHASGGGEWVECRITGCFFTGGTEFGILATMRRCWIDKCVFRQASTSSQDAVVGFQGAIVVTGPASVSKVWITDCEFMTIKNKAIDIDGGGVTVSGCSIWQYTKEGSGVTEWVGINIQPTAYSYTIRDNLIDNDGGTSSVNATGIRTAGGVGHILNNDIEVAAPTATATAIDLTGSSAGVRVDGNVLSGGLLTVLGGPHYVGIGNA
jgi:hypothetical protein